MHDELAANNEQRMPHAAYTSRASALYIGGNRRHTFLLPKVGALPMTQTCSPQAVAFEKAQSQVPDLHKTHPACNVLRTPALHMMAEPSQLACANGLDTRRQVFTIQALGPRPVGLLPVQLPSESVVTKEPRPLQH